MNINNKKPFDYKFIFLGICFVLCVFLFLTIIQGCKTIDIESSGFKAEYDSEPVIEKETEEPVEKEKTEVSDKLKVEDHIGFTEKQKMLIPVIEPPESISISKSKQGKPETNPVYEGASALKQNLKNLKVPPKYRDGKLQGWLYRDNKIYEVHCQVFRTTIIKLEPGEEMVEVPYISEPDVWRISRGIGYTDGIPTQLLMVKPDFSGLISSFIIVTNKRLYQIELSSYWDHYMPMCQWIYDNDIQDTISWLEFQAKQQQEKEEEQKKQELEAKKEYTSYDYTITYNKRPVWCPVGVYDDGQKTYIILDEQCLNMTMPGVFNKRNEIVNFNVEKNKIIINQLIEKVTLKLGSEKVVIRKKKTILTENK